MQQEDLHYFHFKQLSSAANNHGLIVLLIQFKSNKTATELMFIMHIATKKQQRKMITTRLWKEFVYNCDHLMPMGDCY